MGRRLGATDLLAARYPPGLPRLALPGGPVGAGGDAARARRGAPLRHLLAELVAVRPKRLVLLRPGRIPTAEFIVSAARGVEVQR